MAALSLRELQEAFWRALGERPGTEELPAAADSLVALIPPTSTLPPAARLGIYAGMYFWRIVDALREDFPRTAAVLGDEAFAALARRYLAAHPSSHPSLRHAGGALAAFIAAEASDGGPPFLADLARLEWARVSVFDAPDAALLRVDDLRALPAAEWPSLRFAVVPAVAVVETGWPVQRAWDDPSLGELPAETTSLRVWREGFGVFHSAMDASEAQAFARLRDGRTFEEICDVLEDPAAAGALLLRWIEDGLLAAV